MFLNFLQRLVLEPRLSPWLEYIPRLLTQWQQQENNDRNKWLKAINKLPTAIPDKIELQNKVAIHYQNPLSNSEIEKLTNLLQRLHPWRKGPFFIDQIHIDTEWRSDWKWQRILQHIEPLKGRYVLDVGCGNGYHLWRMLGEQAQFLVGIDPSDLFLYQFQAIKLLMGKDNPLTNQVHFLPLGIEDLPVCSSVTSATNGFDTVFSMGVLYHRRSPFEHLLQLKGQLRPHGQLILETLVIDGNEQSVLVPTDRYAQMHNVYFFPSAKALKVWLEKVGFYNVSIVDICTTTIEEQRSTSWMRHQSLSDFLDPTDPSKTIEGYPAPKRAILIANKGGNN